MDEARLDRFRAEVEPGGLSSYPHPRLMPDFWEFPTVSMGLGPLNAIYQARFNRYLEHRGFKDTSDQHVWFFGGDGETAEPESLGALAVASREGLDNLTFVINCNLQQLDGPVRGNGKIIQELEGVFRGAGWNVIKVVWGREWDDLLQRDVDGVLVNRMNEVPDGQMQTYTIKPGDFIRTTSSGPTRGSASSSSTSPTTTSSNSRAVVTTTARCTPPSRRRSRRPGRRRSSSRRRSRAGRSGRTSRPATPSTR
jgi:pyruvate dehydrogenase E1 component